MDPYAQLLMGNALLGPQTNSDCQSESPGKGAAITATKSAPATRGVRGANRVAPPVFRAWGRGAVL